jgi:elongation factor 3
MVLTEEEKELQRQPIEVNWKDEDGKQHKANKIIIELTGTRHESKSKEYEYECKFRDGSELFLPYRQLQRAGWDKACRAIDARIAQRAGQYVRTLSSANVEKHLSDCGLEAEFATHYRMNALSGGQKVISNLKLSKLSSLNFFSSGESCYGSSHVEPTTYPHSG